MFRKCFKDFSTSNLKKKTGLYGTVYDFCADYGAILVDDIFKYSQVFNRKNTT